jgi:hypothetical protein
VSYRLPFLSIDRGDRLFLFADRKGLAVTVRAVLSLLGRSPCASGGPEMPGVARRGNGCERGRVPPNEVGAELEKPG